MSRKQADLIFSLILLGIITWMVWEAQRWDLRARLFPQSIGIPAILIGLLQVFFAVRALLAERSLAVSAAPAVASRPATPPAEAKEVPHSASGSEAVIAEAVEQAFGAGSLVEEEENIDPAVAHARTREMILWIVIMSVAIVSLGFELGASIVSFLFLRFRAHESIKMSLGIAVATYLFFYVLFDRFLNIPFPSGWIADMFGMEPFDHYLMDPIANFIQRR